MNNTLEPEKNNEKGQESGRLSEKTVYVREDDQDWGSAGMNDIQTASE